LQSLTSIGPGVVLAVIELNSGQAVEVTFTITDAGGIRLANPDPDVFTAGPVTVGESRAIVSAVLALDRAAIRPSERGREDSGDPTR